MAKVTGTDRAITERVIKERIRARLDKKDLGQKLGLTGSGYSPYENFKDAFTVEQLFQISLVLGCSVGYLLGLSSELAPDEDRMLALYRQAKGRGPDMAAAILAAAEAMVGLNRS